MKTHIYKNTNGYEFEFKGELKPLNEAIYDFKELESRITLKQQQELELKKAQQRQRQFKNQPKL